MTTIEVELDPRGQGDDAPWHVKGSRAPVPDEVTLTELEVKGSIPSDLTGRYIRNTPNPRTGWTEHWFLGDGMLHGVRLREGRAEWYRNRWVRADHVAAEQRALAISKWGNLFMGAAGVLAAVLSNSSAVLVDGLFSLIGFAAAIIGARISARIITPGTNTAE